MDKPARLTIRVLWVLVKLKLKQNDCSSSLLDTIFAASVIVASSYIAPVLKIHQWGNFWEKKNDFFTNRWVSINPNSLTLLYLLGSFGGFPEGVESCKRRKFAKNPNFCEFRLRKVFSSNPPHSPYCDRPSFSSWFKIRTRKMRSLCGLVGRGGGEAVHGGKKGGESQQARRVATGRWSPSYELILIVFLCCTCSSQKDNSFLGFLTALKCFFARSNSPIWGEIVQCLQRICKPGCNH